MDFCVNRSEATIYEALDKIDLQEIVQLIRNVWSSVAYWWNKPLVATFKSNIKASVQTF